MNGGEDEKPKCGLLALLPKPKGAAMSSTTAKQKISTETNGTFKPEAAIRKQFMALKPRQIPPKQFTKTGMATTSTNGRMAKTNESDSDDEEFEQKLGNVIVDQQQREEEDLPEEGPAKPSQFIAQNKNALEEKPKIFVDRPLLGMDYCSSSDSDDEEEENRNNADEDDTHKIASLPVDFFGLSAPKRPKLDDQIDGSAQIDEPAIFIDEVAPGPARPPKAPLAAHPMGDDDIASSSTAGAGPIRSITNQEASRMIYEKELAPFGVSSVLAEDAVSGMIDVSVDAALGPNVRQNLIRNLNNKQMAQIALGPLPKLKKSEEDKLAKRKHQITHLAQVAVSREEQLQEKWAESKQNKKMSRQKYGF